MAIPSRKQLISGVLDALELWSDEEKTLDDIAAAIVDGMLGLLSDDIKKPVVTPHVGLAFKHPALSGVYHIGYQHVGKVWIVSATSKYGAWIDVNSQFWEYAEISTAKAGAPGNNKAGWKVGDKVSRSQRMYSFEIVQVYDKGALLLGEVGAQPIAESNDELERYYKKEYDW
jgi:hypothetical protein